jgi:HAD superfamily hydrolase (TIGR01549 family)
LPGAERRTSTDLSRISAITFDFGNTLVPVGQAELAAVVEEMTLAVVKACGPFDLATFRAAWAEERDRQFAEDVPEGREVELDRRTVRVLARLRGMPVPAGDERWDDRAAAGWSTVDEVALAIDAYSRAFVAILPRPTGIKPMLARLADRYVLGVLSNWPVASTIDAYLEAAGWSPFFRAVVVSQRVGSIKPNRPIFAAAEAALGQSGPAILHVGDDWAADVIGARQAGWQVAYVRGQQAGSALPASEPDGSAVADLEIDTLAELEPALRAGRRA